MLEFQEDEHKVVKVKCSILLVDDSKDERQNKGFFKNQGESMYID